ncbi:MAG: FoF1 ATP synthase subunit a [Clostridiaceae bacterium]|nr:FoF1 ATP synthase subunit a [Clostridiaceae bacterium]
MTHGKFIFRLVLTIFLLVVGFALSLKRRNIKPLSQEDPDYNKNKKQRKNLLLWSVISLWLGCGLAIGFFATEKETLNFQVMAPRVDLFGMDISSSVLISWVAIAILTISALFIRIFVIPKFTDKPGGLQNVLELIVESISSYTQQTAGKLGDNLSAYILSVAALLVTCGLLELFGLRPPTADLEMTLSLALCSFVLINYYGIKKKGVSGRIKSLAEPAAAIMPLRLLSDIAIPVSMGCRLFGNMLGGMIVVDLVYLALGSFSVGIPAVLGLYFNLFHPLIQTFIFITLSLTFINEAAE